MNKHSFVTSKIRSRYFICISLIILLSVSCRELVQDEFPDFKPVPTVNSILIADSILTVHVSMASKMDSMPLKLVDQADVKLFIDGAFSETLVSAGEGKYTSTSTVKPGKRYQCKVKLAGYDEVTCVDSIPVPNPILKIEHIKVAGIDEEGYTYPAIKFTFSNHPGEQRFYEVIIHLDRGDYWTTSYLKEITDPVLLAEGLPMPVFSNEMIEGNTYTMLLNYSSGSYTTIGGVLQQNLDPFVLELRSISYDYYHYLKQLYLYDLGRYPDFLSGVGSVFPLHTNVHNGYGIFAGYSSFFSEVINPE